MPKQPKRKVTEQFCIVEEALIPGIREKLVFRNIRDCHGWVPTFVYTRLPSAASVKRRQPGMLILAGVRNF